MYDPVFRARTRNPIRGAGHVEELTGRHLGAHAVEPRHPAFEPAGGEPAGPHEPFREHEREIAHQDGRRRAERIGIGSGRSLLREPDVGRRDPPALVVAVHQVVVHEGGRVEELERSAHPDDRIALRPAGRRERPEADRRSHALAAGLEEPEELVHERRGRRIHAGELRPAVAEEPAERAVDRWADAFERGR